MKSHKAVSLFVSASLLLNAAMVNTAYSQNNLAAPSILNDFTGTRSRKDIDEIRLLLQTFLMGAANGETGTTVKRLINYVDEYRGSMSRDVNFFVNEDLKLPTGFKLEYGQRCIMFRTNRGADCPENVRTYYVVFSLERDPSGGFPINIYTRTQWKGLGEVKDRKISPRENQSEPRWERVIEKERIYPVLRIAGASRPKEKFDLSHITAEVVLALESSGLCGKGKAVKNEIDELAVETIRNKLMAIAAAYNVKFIHVTGEGEKDRGERKGVLSTMFGGGEVIGSEDAPYAIYI